MASESRTSVGLLDVAKGALAMVPDVPGIVRHAPGLILRRPSAESTIGSVFNSLVAKHPERPFIRFEGNSITYGEANRRINRYADFFSKNGVGQGDVVGVLAKNHPQTLLVMIAAVKLGAVAGMLNYNQRGKVLTHSLGILEATVLVVDPEVREALESIDDDHVLPSVTVDFDELNEATEGLSEENPAVTAGLPAKTKAFYIFTSGTTGMPKASIMSHYRWMTSMDGIGGMGVRLRHSDTMYSALPLYHNNALTVALSSVLASGACLAIGKSFSASRFWDDVIQNRATAFCYIGELCRYLMAQPEKPTDRSHGVKVIVGNGMRAEIWEKFTQRFGIERVVEFYGASELNLAFINVFNLTRTAGFCPLPYKVVEYDHETGDPKRNGDGRLTKVSKGEAGLLISEISDRVPFDGYTDEEASNKKIISDAFKDGDRWFNSGDLVRDLGMSHIAFVDRLGDTFRWKGENVATTEVEGALAGVDTLDQAVVYGVEVPGSDGKAGMASVTVREGADLDPKALAKHLYDELPQYAVPLFLRVVDQLEQTSTFKNRKVELRDQGYADVGDDALYVLTGSEDGYIEFYDEYPDDVAGAKVPRG
ncbi:fatty-acyl-CoA synthase [Williamsia muralis]|uniref:Fatty-acyl-CoA synthase n=2 Tax=Williamsia marianensis TaxID=85044 RepID=A0A495K0K0_WILMA|nr:fatty-acyl-CoA synthase [Williamsia muralis]